VEALRRRKVGAIIALSFARIFYRNAINLGIPLLESPEIVAAVRDGDEVDVDLNAGTLARAGQVYRLPELPLFAKEIVNAGGIVAYVREHGRFPGEAG
jgi:methanogen homoaconitase small subunit